MDHYFLTPHVDEQDAIDRGAIKGWQRTGYSFLGYLTASVGLSGVCRFYYTNYVVDSHFYTANPAECGKLISEGIWQLEERAFLCALPTLLADVRQRRKPSNACTTMATAELRIIVT